MVHAHTFFKPKSNRGTRWRAYIGGVVPNGSIRPLQHTLNETANLIVWRKLMKCAHRFCACVWPRGLWPCCSTHHRSLSTVDFNHFLQAIHTQAERANQPNQIKRYYYFWILKPPRHCNQLYKTHTRKTDKPESAFSPITKKQNQKKYQTQSTFRTTFIL